MPAKLIAINGPLAGQRFALEDDLVTLGREVDNLLVIPDDSVSSTHAVIERSGSRWMLRDRGSTNGTRVNGDDVYEAALRDGDRIELGFVEFRFELPSPESSSERVPLSLANPIRAPVPAAPPPADIELAPVSRMALRAGATIAAPVSAPPPREASASAPARRPILNPPPTTSRLAEDQIDAILYWTRPRPAFFFAGLGAVAVTVAAILFYFSVAL